MVTIKSKDRVRDFGEVLTPEKIVNDMLDLVKRETLRIDSRFLEPACGTGNFLIEILRRKLDVVGKKYRKEQIEYERYSVLAVSSIYGIDLLEDNVIECRSRLFELYKEKYSKLYGLFIKKKLLESVSYILSRNIICGDALTLKTVGDNPEPIIFSEWSLFNGSMVIRRDFAFYELMDDCQYTERPLFSDLGEKVFIPKPKKEYSPVHFMEIANAYDK